MTVEAVKGAVMTYQGSSSGTAAAREQTQKSDAGMSADASEKIAREISEPETKQADADGGDSGGSSPAYEGCGKKNKQLQQAVDKLKKNLNQQTEAVFGFHEGTKRVMIKIVDKNTKDVIKEYPPEKTLDMIQKVWEMAGIMVDEKG